MNVHEIMEKLSQITIVEVAQEFFPGSLRQIGDNYQGLCPVHTQEKISSFYIKPEPDWARCYSCGYEAFPIEFAKQMMSGLGEELYLCEMVKITDKKTVETLANPRDSMNIPLINEVIEHLIREEKKKSAQIWERFGNQKRYLFAMKRVRELQEYAGPIHL